MSDTFTTESRKAGRKRRNIETEPRPRLNPYVMQSGARSTGTGERLARLQSLHDILSAGLEALRADAGALPAVGFRGRDH